jgi:hypothetical protein
MPVPEGGLQTYRQRTLPPARTFFPQKTVKSRKSCGAEQVDPVKTAPTNRTQQEIQQPQQLGPSIRQSAIRQSAIGNRQSAIGNRRSVTG